MAAVERTLAIVKPDGVKAGNIGNIIAMIEKEGLTIVAAKLALLTDDQAKGFYAVHADKPFFGELVTFMTSGPVMLMVLEGEGAIKRWRDLMGPTNSEKARETDPGTIRALYGTDIQNNATHGSDAPETAAFEIGHFFSVFDYVK